MKLSIDEISVMCVTAHSIKICSVSYVDTIVCITWMTTIWGPHIEMSSKCFPILIGLFMKNS